MSTRASAGTTGSPSSFRWERGWFATSLWRSLSMSAIESRFLPYTGIVAGRYRAGYLLSLRWLEGEGERGGFVPWVLKAGGHPPRLIDTASRTGQQSPSHTRVTPMPDPVHSLLEHVDHILFLPSIGRLATFCSPNSLAAPVENIGRGASGPVSGSKFCSISG